MHHQCRIRNVEHAAQESHDIDRKGTMLTDVEQQCHERCWNLLFMFLLPPPPSFSILISLTALHIVYGLALN